MNILRSRSEARVQGLLTYFTGKPCKYGHVAERHVSNLTCLECNRIKSRKFTQENPEKNKRKCKLHYEANKARYIESAYRRLGKLKQRIFPHEVSRIKQIYDDCPEGHEVDHQIPLTHPKVCGLHCVANLQYLTIQANRSKFNHWNTDL